MEGIWVCENPEKLHKYAEYVNGCPRCWQDGLLFGVRHAPLVISASAYHPAVFKTYTGKLLSGGISPLRSINA